MVYKMYGERYRHQDIYLIEDVKVHAYVLKRQTNQLEEIIYITPIGICKIRHRNVTVNAQGIRLTKNYLSERATKDKTGRVETKKNDWK